MLGGSSALNAQAFIAPSEAGIEAWRAFGNPGWDWNTMTEYYQKCHTLEVPPADVCAHLGLDYLIEGKYRGKNGPIQTSYSGTLEDSLGKAWVNTFRSMNYALTGDPFSGGTTGGFANPTTVNSATKERSYAASAYYAPVKGRSNLHLLTGVQVEKILFEAKSDPAVATAVQFTRNGTLVATKARKEVILAAGTFNSPKLLELSGIGGGDLLRSKGIEVIIDNPNVGENFHDHPMTGVSFEVKDDVKTLDDLYRQDPKALEAAMTAYQTTKTGPFSTGAVNSFAFMPIVEFQSPQGQTVLEDLLKRHESNANSTKERLDYDFFRSVITSTDKSSVAYFMFAGHGIFGGDANDTTTIQQKVDGNFITVSASLSYPLSRGSAHISSASAADKPTIDCKLLAHPLDLDIFARQVRFIDTIVQSEPLASLLKPGGKRSPTFSDFGTDLDAVKDYVRKTTISGWHPVGTCAMLPREKGGVVNERLLVHGAKNVRVVDASIMPLISRGNTQTTVYAVAERAAVLIKEDHQVTLNGVGAMH